MNSATLTHDLPAPNPSADRVGVFASILCAIHCLVTPPLLLLMPTFGRVWAHPATHWIMALVVVPLAMFAVWKGFKKHGRKWVVIGGALGVTLVIAGAILPYVGSDSSAVAEGCDACCPSVTTDAAGKAALDIPAASVVTTLGGVLLIATHIGNLCSCRCCRRSTFKVKAGA